MNSWFRGAVMGALTSFLMLTAAAGCVKFERPHLGEFDFQSKTAVSAGGPLVNCDDLPSLPMKLSQYPALRQTLLSLSKELTPKLLEEAHARAMNTTIFFVRSKLIQRGQRGEAKYFFDSAKRAIKMNDPRPDEDIAALLRIGKLPEGNACSNIFLKAFYDEFVKQADPLGRIEYLSVSDAGLGGAAESVLRLPEGDAYQAKLDTIAPGVDKLVLRNWRYDQSWMDVLREIRERIQSHSTQVLVLDIRSAAGEEVGALSLLRAEARGAWSGFPVVIWQDGYTRGTPEVFAFEFALQNPRAVVIGPRSFGYPRSTCSSELAVDGSEGTFPLRLSVGCRIIPTLEGLGPDHVGTPSDLPGLLDSTLAIEGDALSEARQALKKLGIQPRKTSSVPSPAPLLDDVQRQTRVDRMNEFQKRHPGYADDASVAELARIWATD